MSARRLATALAAAAVMVSSALVAAGPASAASEQAGPAAAALSVDRTTHARPPVLAAPAASRRASFARSHRRPLFAFWGRKYNRIDGFTFATARRGSGTSVQVEAAWKTYRGVRPILPKRVFLQARVDGGKWTKVRGSKGRIGKRYVVARAPAHVVPAGVAVQTVDYRLRTRKVTKGPRRARRSVASKPVTVSFDNQSTYTGDQARFYAPIAHLCPTASVTLDTDSTIAVKRDAVFSWQYGIAIDVDEIDAVTGESEASKLAVAVHECAHAKQFYNWGGTMQDWSTLKERSAAVFVADDDPSGPTPPMQSDWSPLEHAADCATFVATSGAERTYGGYCNPAESAAAGLLWQNQTY